MVPSYTDFYTQLCPSPERNIMEQRLWILNSTIQWLLEHFQHMKQALSFQTFLLMNNLAQNTDPLPGCQQMLVFVNIYIYNAIKLYLLCILTNRCTVSLNWSWQIQMFGLLCWMCQMYTGSSRRPKSAIDSKILKFCRLVYRRSGVKYVLKRVSFWSKGCTKELKLECAYFLCQTS